MPNRVQRLRIHPPQACQLVGIDAIALPLTTLRPFHQPRVGHQHLVSPLGDHVLHPSRVRSYFHHYPRHGQCLRTPLHLPALSATVLRPAFLPPNQECSTDSSGLPDLLPPSDDLDWGQLCFPCDFLLRSSTPPAHPVFDFATLKWPHFDHHIWPHPNR